MFYVYFLRSSGNELYIGQTINLQIRQKQQINKTVKSAKFVKDGQTFKLVYFEKFTTRLEAMRREKQLKGWSRAKKEALINGEINKSKNLSKTKVEKF